MSNIAQKTAPPGSWPCNKGELGDTNLNQDPSAMEPRSPPAVPEYEGFNGGSTGDWSQSGDYTHRDPQAKPQEERESQEDGNQQQEPIKMKEVEPQPVGENEETQEVGGQEEEEKKTIKEDDTAAGVEQQSVQQEPEVKTGDNDEAPAETATDSALTEKAKQAFDQASENQPTNDARDSFLQAARSKLTVPKFSSPRGQEEEEKEEEQQPPESEAAEIPGVPPAETQEEAQSGKKKQMPTVDDRDEAAPEPQEQLTEGKEDIPAPEDKDKEAPKLQEQPTENKDEPTAEDAATKAEDAATKAEDAATKDEDAAAKDEQPQPDLSILKDGTVNKGGNVVARDGTVVGRVVEGEVKQLVGKKVDEHGAIWSSSGKVVGRAEAIPDGERDEMLREPAPFESFPDAVVDKDGMVTAGAGGEIIGRVVEGEKRVLRGKAVDVDGDILDKVGNVVGKAERWEPEPEAEPEPEPEVDKSALAGKRVNKAGNVVDTNGAIFGRVVEGDMKRMVGRMCDKNGNILSESGDVLGRAELVPEREREGLKEGPFAKLQGCTVAKDGTIVTPAGDIVGRLTSGDGKTLFGYPVDEDGDILDKNGNTVGKAERWEPEPEAEPEPEPEVDKSALAGKRVNKAGNVVDANGAIFGRVIEGDVKRMVGRMCDKNGNILSESGDVLGRAELVSEGEREGLKEGPFAELQGCTVAKDGTIVTPAGDIVGRLTSGDGKTLFGRPVDEDGDILDKNGNTVGKAERWEPEKVEHKKNPMSGRRVNREGNVVDEDGNLIGKLTSGTLSICAGKDIDDDGDVVDYKGNTVGHCSLLEDIPEEPKEEESPEEKEKREQAEKDKKLAIQMSVCIEQCLDSIRPICKLITEKIDKAERTPEDERDEEALVQEVRPLIEEGGRILNEAKGIIKGLDPDGRIAANAKHKTAAREATPEEYHLAEVLKDLTGDVTQCIDNAKRKLEGMPHAKKELNPLWGLLNEPLFQILAAVGLLLAGVLNLVGRLLSGLGLGGIVDGLLGTLGLNRVLESLGLGSFSKSLKSGKKGGGGLLGGVLGR